MVTWTRACLTDAVRWAWMDYICAANAIKPYRILQVVRMVTGSDLLDLIISGLLLVIFIAVVREI